MRSCTSKRRRAQFGQEEPRPRCQMYCFYCFGLGIMTLLILWTLRDNTPVRFIQPSLEDGDKFDSIDAQKLEDVYWRVSIRHVSSTLNYVCNNNNYTVLTNRNILLDEQSMVEKYIFFCNSDMLIRSAVNARAVITSAAKKSVLCREVYAGKAQTIRRYYPFSLKYISSQTFTSKTRVIRDAKETCLWQHAISIVDGSWFSTI